MTSPTDRELREAYELLGAAQSSIERIHTHNGWGGGHPNGVNTRWRDTRSALSDLAGAVRVLADRIAAQAARQDEPNGCPCPVERDPATCPFTQNPTRKCGVPGRAEVAVGPGDPGFMERCRNILAEFAKHRRDDVAPLSDADIERFAPPCASCCDCGDGSACGPRCDCDCHRAHPPRVTPDDWATVQGIAEEANRIGERLEEIRGRIRQAQACQKCDGKGSVYAAESVFGTRKCVACRGTGRAGET